MVVLFSFIVSIHLYTMSVSFRTNWSSTTWIPLARLSFWVDMETSCIALLLWVAWFRLLDHLTVFQKFSRLIVMIEMMLTQMRSFLILFFVILAAFSTAMYTAYGYKDPQTFTLFRSLLMRMQETFDSVDTAQAMQHNRVLGVFFSVLFMLGLSLLLLNLLVAILTSAYESATQDIGAAYWAKRQYSIVAEELCLNRSCYITFCQCYGV
jgi:hypothetical protein